MLRRGGDRRRKVIIACMLLVLAGGVAVPMWLNTQHAEAWWDGNWLYRRKITLSNASSSAPLTDFPVRISLSAANGNINYSKTLSGGNDLRFVDSDDSTVLDYEIESWNSSGTSEVWVRVPQVDATNTDYIWMYYGNAGASAGANPTGVWDTGYKLVQHLEESSACAVTFTDSTSNAQNGSCSGSSTVQSSGKIGNARTLTGGNAITIPDNAMFVPGTNPQTIEVWAKYFSTSSGPIIDHTSIAFGTGWTMYQNVAVGTCGANKLCYWDGNSDQGLAAGTTTNTWYHLVIVKSGTTATLYVNGSSVGTLTVISSIGAASNVVSIGADSFGGAFDGDVDEVRYSSAARSADWVAASYASQNTYNGFASYGAEEVYPPEPPVLTSPGNATSTQPTFQLRSADPSVPSYLRYKIEVCSTNNCSSIIRTIDQTSSQTGWSGQDAQTGTAYAAAAVVTSSTLASHTYQTPALSAGTQYWWRAYAIDPAGSNTWSAASSIDSFITQGSPAAPSLVEPLNTGSAPDVFLIFRLWTTDINADYVQYKIEVCSTSNCSSIIRTIDQSAAQTGWSSQNAASNTAYTAVRSPITSSQQASHTYQNPSLTPNAQYWWRAYAIDPAGSNTWSAASSIYSFTTNPSLVRLTGGTKIQGGTKIGP